MTMICNGQARKACTEYPGPRAIGRRMDFQFETEQPDCLSRWRSDTVIGKRLALR